MSDLDERRCPRCGRTASSLDDLFCEEDGARLAGPQARNEVVQPQGDHGACGRCGAVWSDDADDYCSRCGHARGRTLRPREDSRRRIDQCGPELVAISDIGKRHDLNEDAFAVARGATWAVMVVCDGVSSSIHSERASKAAAESIRDEVAERAAVASAESEADLGFRETVVRTAIETAHSRLCALFPARAGLGAPGTTVVAAWIASGFVTVGWVGDSRLYAVCAASRFRAARPRVQLLTHDHSWVNEVVAAGEMSMDAALASPNAHALTRCIGALEEADRATVSVRSHLLEPGSIVLACTDGLWNYVATPEQLEELLASVSLEGQSSPGATSKLAVALVDYALGRGGDDNVTVAVFRTPADERSRSTISLAAEQAAERK